MHIDFDDNYTTLTDKEIIDRIINESYNEECATYLIYNRYEPLCKSMALKIFNNLNELDTIQSELFILLKGDNQDWSPLKSFQWRCSFGSWLKVTVFHLSLKLKKELIENGGNNLSLETANNCKDEDNTIDEDKARAYRMVLLLEAINMVNNPDQKFVVLKRLEGYKSKEIAYMLQEHWDKQGIIHYNNKHEIVKLDSGNIDNLFKRGFKKVTEIFKTLDRK